MSAEEIYLDADTLRGDFMPSLTDRARCLPIVLMTTDDDGKTPVWDATELASKLVGMATVYVIDMRDGVLVQAFRDLLPTEHRPGATGSGAAPSWCTARASTYRPRNRYPPARSSRATGSSAMPPAGATVSSTC